MSRIWFWLVALSLAAPGRVLGAPTPADSATSGTAEAARRAGVVAKYDGGEITVGEVEDAMAGLSAMPKGKWGDPVGAEGWYASLLDFELELMEAVRRGYDKDGRVTTTTADVAIQFMLEALADKPTDAFEPSDELLAQYFEEHKSEIAVPELRRVNILVVSSPEKARELTPQFQQAKGQALRELIQTHSLDEATNKDSGFSRYFDRAGDYDDHTDKVDPKLAEATYQLDAVGAVSDVVELSEAGKYAVIRLAAIRPAYDPTLQQAMPVVRKRVVEAYRKSLTDAIADEARKYMKPVLHPELVDLLPEHIPSAPEQ